MLMLKDFCNANWHFFFRAIRGSAIFIVLTNWLQMQMDSGLDAIFTLARCFYSIKLKKTPKIYRLKIYFCRYRKITIALKERFHFVAFWNVLALLNQWLTLHYDLGNASLYANRLRSRIWQT